MDDDAENFEVSDYDIESSDGEQIQNESDSDGITSDEEEVLPVGSDSDSEDGEDVDEANISDSDINDDNDDLPDSKAWGRNKRSYYNGDNINDKTSHILNEEDEEAAKMEEEEAEAIQKRLISRIDDADIAFDLLSDVMVQKEDNETFRDQDEKIEVDLSLMNEQEKMELLKKESPELLIYIEDYKALMTSIRDEMMPAMKILKKNKFEDCPPGQFIKLYRQLILNYCTNIVFYILLKLRRTNTKLHPCSRWLNEYKNILNETKPIYEEVFKPQLKLILSDKFKLFSISNSKSNLTDKRVGMEGFASNHEQEDPNMINCDSYSIEEDVDDTMGNDVDEENDETESKRPITYQIAKNKGLTPYRKKELRNPRVKHRMKYRKAKIRRKGQIREVRKEIRKYDGEISGIKANVIKSVKFR